MLSLARLTSEEDIRAVYADPGVLRVGHDHRTAGPVFHPEAHYLGAAVDGKPCGGFLIIESGWVEWDVHALLHGWAWRHFREFGRMCIAHCFNVCADLQRLTAQVLGSLTSARNYCIKLGFTVEGFRRDAVRVAGAPMGVWVLGITRRDWEAACLS